MDFDLEWRQDCARQAEMKYYETNAVPYEFKRVPFLGWFPLPIKANSPLEKKVEVVKK